MTRVVAAIAVLALVGCGPGGPSVPGTYDGVLVAYLNCGSSGGGQNSGAVRFIVTVAGTNAFLNDNSDCAPFTGTVSGSTVTLNPRICPTHMTQQGDDETDTLTSGTATFTDEGMQFSSTVSVHVSGSGGSMDCTGTQSGSFSRG